MKPKQRAPRALRALRRVRRSLASVPAEVWVMGAIQIAAEVIGNL